MKYEVPNDDVSKLDAMHKDIDAKLAAVGHRADEEVNNMILEHIGLSQEINGVL